VEARYGELADVWNATRAEVLKMSIDNMEQPLTSYEILSEAQNPISVGRIFNKGVEETVQLRFKSRNSVKHTLKSSNELSGLSTDEIDQFSSIRFSFHDCSFPETADKVPRPEEVGLEDEATLNRNRGQHPRLSSYIELSDPIPTSAADYEGWEENDMCWQADWTSDKARVVFEIRYKSLGSSLSHFPFLRELTCYPRSVTEAWLYSRCSGG